MKAKDTYSSDSQRQQIEVAWLILGILMPLFQIQSSHTTLIHPDTLSDISAVKSVGYRLCKES